MPVNDVSIVINGRLYHSGTFLLPFFPVKVIFKPARSTDLWCYKDVVQSVAKGSTISSPLREFKLPLEAVLATPRKMAYLTGLAVHNSLSSVHSEALIGRKRLLLPAFPCCC